MSPFFNMGLFSQTVLHQSSQVLSLIEDTPNLVGTSVITSILGNTSVATDLTNNIMASLSSSVSRYHKYGKNSYTNGLPEGTMGELTIDTHTMRAVLLKHIALLPNEDIEIVYATFDEYNAANFARETLRETTNWNPETFLVTFKEHGEVMVDPTLTTFYDATRLQIQYEFNYGTEYRLLTRYGPYPMVLGNNYYFTEYFILNSDGERKDKALFWNYDPLTNQYPELAPEGIGGGYTQYMPIVPLRVNNQSLTDSAHMDTPLYKTSKQLLGILDISIKELDEGVNNNPDINSIDHAYVVMGVSLHTDKPESISYLFEFFRDLSTRSNVTKVDFDKWNSGITTPPINIVHINDATYSAYIAYYYATRSYVTGSLGKIGTATREIIQGAGRLTYRSLDSGSNDNGGYIYGCEDPASTLILKKQVTETQYEVVTVAGAVHVNRMHGAADYFTNITKQEHDNFIIPINVSIVSQFSTLQRNTIYYDSIKIVFHAYEYQKLKWYETGFFKFVMLVVSIAFTVFTAGASSFITGLIGAISAGAIAFMQFILPRILGIIAVKYAFQLAAEHLGVEVAAILATIAILLGAAGNESLFNLPNADILSLIGTTGFKSAMQVGQDIITAGFESLDVLTSDREQQLEDAQSKLETVSSIDPLSMFTSMGMVPMESMDSYVNRSLMVNSGLLSISAVSSYVDTQLSLPTLRGSV